MPQSVTEHPFPTSHLAACGGTSAEEGDAAAITTTTTTTTVAPATTEAPGATEEAPAAERIIVHDLGTTTLVGDPQRVVSLVSWASEAAFALGVQPIGAVFHPEWVDGLVYMAPLFSEAGTVNVGSTHTPNIEAIIKLKPDLIIAQSDPTARVYGQLSKIAPTVMIGSEEPWRVRFLFAADALNKRDEAITLLAEYEQTVAETREELQAVLGDNTLVSMFIWQKQFGLNSGDTWNRVVVDDLGVRPPDGLPTAGWGEWMSFEGVLNLDPDYIVLTLPEETSAEREIHDPMVDAWLADPLWQTLSAVQNDRVFTIRGEIIGDGFISVNLRLEQIQGLIPKLN